jgi:hypothetical protein
MLLCPQGLGSLKEQLFLEAAVVPLALEDWEDSKRPQDWGMLRGYDSVVSEPDFPGL